MLELFERADLLCDEMKNEHTPDFWAIERKGHPAEPEHNYWQVFYNFKTLPEAEAFHALAMKQNSHGELLAALKVTQERLGKLGLAVPEVDAAIAKSESQ